MLYLVPAPRIQISGVAQASGPARHIGGMLRAWRDLGWKTDVWLASSQKYARRATGMSESDLRGNRISLIRQDLARIAFGMLSTLVLLPRAIGSGRPAVVYERLASLQVLGLLFQAAGAKWVIESNGLFYKEAVLERKSIYLAGIAKRMEILAYRRADLIVCVSEALKEQICDVSGAPSERVVVVRNAIDPSSFAPPARSPMNLVNAPLVGFVGTLIEWQGLDRLLRAAKILAESGFSMRVQIVGDGPDLERLRSMASEFSLDVTFAGRVAQEDVAGLMAEFDVGYAGHSMKSGVNYHSPLKLYEYAACGVRIVSTPSEDAYALARDYPVEVIPPTTGDDELATILRRSLESPRPRPLRITYHDRIGQLSQLVGSPR